MKRIKIWFFAMMLTLVMPVCLAAGERTSDTCTHSQMDEIVAKEVQRQVNTIVKDSLEQWADSKIIDLKIDKAANEKLDRLQAEHDDLITQVLALIGVLFTILAAIIGILIPLLMNRKIEQKLDENTKGLEKSKKELEESKARLSLSEKKLEESKAELNDSKARLAKSEEALKQTREDLELSKRDLKEVEKKMVKIHNEVVQMKQEAQTSKDEAEKAAMESKYSEALSRFWVQEGFDKKIEMISKLMEEYPENDFLAQSYYNRGRLYANYQNFEKAIEDYTEAINRGFSQAFFDRAFLYLGKDYEKAIKDFTEAIKTNPNDADAYYYRGFAYHKIQNNTNAFRDYAQAISMEPKNAHMYHGITELLCDMGDYKTAEVFANEAILNNPDYIISYQVRWEVYEKTGRFKDALADVQKAMEIAKRNENAETIKSLEEKIAQIEAALKAQNNNNNK